jgi:hypothetical protein
MTCKKLAREHAMHKCMLNNQFMPQHLTSTTCVPEGTYTYARLVLSMMFLHCADIMVGCTNNEYLQVLMDKYYSQCIGSVSHLSFIIQSIHNLVLWIPCLWELGRGGCEIMLASLCINKDREL